MRSMDSIFSSTARLLTLMAAAALAGCMGGVGDGLSDAPYDDDIAASEDDLTVATLPCWATIPDRATVSFDTPAVFHFTPSLPGYYASSAGARAADCPLYVVIENGARLFDSNIRIDITAQDATPDLTALEYTVYGHRDDGSVVRLDSGSAASVSRVYSGRGYARFEVTASSVTTHIYWDPTPPPRPRLYYTRDALDVSATAIVRRPGSGR